MKIDVSSLIENPERTLRHDETWQPDTLELAGDQQQLNQPVNVDFVIRYVSGTFQVEGHYDTVLDLQCSRCLNYFEEDFSYSVRADYVQDRSEVEPEEDSEVQYILEYEDDELDLGELVRQDLHVQRPMKPICDESCEGLCPVCGANRNEEDCGHEGESVDPRMEKLQEIDIEESDLDS